MQCFAMVSDELDRARCELYLDVEASSVDPDDHVLGGVRSPELQHQLQPTPPRRRIGRHHRPVDALVPAGNPGDRQGRDRRQRAERDRRTARRDRDVAPDGERTPTARRVDRSHRERAAAPSVVDQGAGATAGVDREGAAATPGGVVERASRAAGGRVESNGEGRCPGVEGGRCARCGGVVGRCDDGVVARRHGRLHAENAVGRQRRRELGRVDVGRQLDTTVELARHLQSTDHTN